MLTFNNVYTILYTRQREGNRQNGGRRTTASKTRTMKSAAWSPVVRDINVTQALDATSTALEGGTAGQAEKDKD